MKINFIRHTVFALLVFPWAPPTFGEPVQEITFDTSPIQSAAPTLHVKTLSPNMKLAPAESNSPPPSEPQTPRPNPIPKMKSAQKKHLPLFPIYSNAGATYVSLLRTGTEISKPLEDQLRALWQKENSANFFVEGKIVTDLLKDLHFTENGTFYLRMFESSKVHKFTQIKKLQIRTNGAGDGMFGTIALQVPLETRTSESGLQPIGLAWFANEDPFSENILSEVKLSNASLSMVSQNQLETIAEYLQPSQEPAHFETAQEAEAPLDQWKLVEVTLPFESTQDFKQNLLGYFLKREDRTLEVRNFYTDGTYGMRAQKILSGQLFRDYKQTIIFPSTGMGDCGKVLSLDSNDSWIETDLPCGSWGC